MMRWFRHTLLLIGALVVVASCTKSGDEGDYVRHICDFEGAYWDALVDSDPNGSNLLNGTIATSWHDEQSDLAGSVSQPYEGYWEGVALSNHCTTDYTAHSKPTDQLYAYAESAHSGNNLLICNAFTSSPSLYFESRRGSIESLQVALTTYSYATVTQGNHLTSPLPSDKSIWIRAEGFREGSESAIATEEFYLYRNGKATFEGWTKWSMRTMHDVDLVVFNIQWDGVGYNPYPAYFALDDIVVVRSKSKE